MGFRNLQEKLENVTLASLKMSQVVDLCSGHWGQLPEKRWPLPVTGPSQHSFIIVKSGESKAKI